MINSIQTVGIERDEKFPNSFYVVTASSWKELDSECKKKTIDRFHLWALMQKIWVCYFQIEYSTDYESNPVPSTVYLRIARMTQKLESVTLH